MSDPQPTYNVDHFIRKFEARPERTWCTNGFGDRLGRRCALGACLPDLDSGQRVSDESKALWDLFYFGLNETVTHVNDGIWEREGDAPEWIKLPTPRDRILCALREIKRRTGAGGGQ